MIDIKLLIEIIILVASVVGIYWKMKLENKEIADAVATIKNNDMHEIHGLFKGLGESLDKVKKDIELIKVDIGKIQEWQRIQEKKQNDRI